MTDTSTSDKSLPALVSELWELVLAYARQETVDPLKRLGRFAKYGLIGSVLVAVGFVLLALAALRSVQEETVPHLTGNWSWVPYASTLVASVMVAGLLARRIGADKRRAERQQRSNKER